MTSREAAPVPRAYIKQRPLLAGGSTSPLPSSGRPAHQWQFSTRTVEDRASERAVAMLGRRRSGSSSSSSPPKPPHAEGLPPPPPGAGLTTVVTDAGGQEVVAMSQFVTQLDEAARKRLDSMNQRLGWLEQQMETLEAEVGKASTAD
ncbi:hypothetical protein ABZP36_014894 [Zizania latifolia]